MSKKLYIISSIILFSLVVSFVDAVVKPTYFIKILVKIFFFLGIPFLYFIIHKEDLKEFKKMFSLKNNGILKALGLGLIVYFSIVIGYFITRTFIDYSNVAPNLMGSMGINKDNFIYVTIYISLLNSFLEEIFFRGFGVITLKKYTSRKFAYTISSIFFSIYHAGMMIGSFDIITYFLIIIGLFIGGLMFSYLNEVNESIYPSWITHMFTNFGINTVGFILFSVL